MRKRKRKKISTHEKDIRLLAYATRAQTYRTREIRPTVGYECKKPIGAADAPSYEKWMKELYGY